jgi:F-type H+-transporting ATPase subunit gamma
MQAMSATSAYAEKAMQVLVHLAKQPGHQMLHPLLAERSDIRNTLCILITSDRGLAGSYNVNIVRKTLNYFEEIKTPVSYVAVGRKGRDMLVRRRKKVVADFSQIPTPPRFNDVSAIGWLAVDEFLEKNYDQIFIAYTQFESMLSQIPVVRRILPLFVQTDDEVDPYQRQNEARKTSGVYSYEPGQTEILDEIVPRFTALQIYQSILVAQASENAARMMSMQNATENASELISFLQLDYNKARQQSITNEMLDIAGGAEALSQAK